MAFRRGDGDIKPNFLKWDQRLIVDGKVVDGAEGEVKGAKVGEIG